MNEHYQWMMRRLRRTWWLLRQPDTRAETAGYLAAYSYQYVRSARRTWQTPRPSTQAPTTLRATRGR